MEFHHIGIACADIAQMKLYLNKIYDVTSVSEEVYDELQKATLCMMTLKDGTKMELVKGEIVDKLVKRHQFLYHVCYSTRDIGRKIKELEDLGAKMISEPKAAKLFGGKQVAFLMTQLGIVELLESWE
mgnify:CR=1 FL=1